MGSGVKKIPNTNTVLDSGKKRCDSRTRRNKQEHLKYLAQPIIIAKCEDIINWAYSVAERPREEWELITIQSYLSEKRIKRSTFDFWCSQHSEIKEARDNAREILSEMHLRLAASGKSNAAPISTIAMVYNQDFKEGKQVEADLKAKAQAQQQPIVSVGVPTYFYPSKAEDHEKDSE